MVMEIHVYYFLIWQIWNHSAEYPNKIILHSYMQQFGQIVFLFNLSFWPQYLWSLSEGKYIFLNVE